MQGKGDSAPGLVFLFTEIETGLTFADIALGAKPHDVDKIRRNTANARTAYDTVLRFRSRVDVDEAGAKRLEAVLAQLRAALLELGESV